MSSFLPNVTTSKGKVFKSVEQRAAKPFAKPLFVFQSQHGAINFASFIIKKLPKPCQDAFTLPRSREMEIQMNLPGFTEPVSLIGSPMKFSRTKVDYRLPPPRVGEHTEQVLLEYGILAAVLLMISKYDTHSLGHECDSRFVYVFSHVTE